MPEKTSCNLQLDLNNNSIESKRNHHNRNKMSIKKGLCNFFLEGPCKTPLVTPKTLQPSVSVVGGMAELAAVK